MLHVLDKIGLGRQYPFKSYFRFHQQILPLDGNLNAANKSIDRHVGDGRAQLVRYRHLIAAGIFSGREAGGAGQKAAAPGWF